MRRYIEEVLITRDNDTFLEARARVKEARGALVAYLQTGQTDKAAGVCKEFFNLGPEYISQLIKGVPA